MGRTRGGGGSTGVHQLEGTHAAAHLHARTCGRACACVFHTRRACSISPRDEGAAERGVAHGVHSGGVLCTAPQWGVYSVQCTVHSVACTAEVRARVTRGSQDRQWTIQSTSAVKGEGLSEGMDWLANVLAAQQ